MQKQKRSARTGFTCAMLGATAIFLAACVVEPYPPQAPMAYAPEPAPAYYPGPYSYYDYPPYPGYAYGGPSVGFVFGGGGGWHGDGDGGRGHWR